MSVTRVSRNTASISGSTGTVTLGATPTAGNLLIFTGEAYDTGLATLGVSSGPDGFTQQTFQRNVAGSTRAIAILYWKISDGTETSCSITFSATGGASAIALCVEEWSGLAQSSPVDVTMPGAVITSDGTVSSGSATTTNADDFLYAFIGGFQGSTPAPTFTWGDGFTADADFAAGSGRHATATQVVSATGSYDASVTLNGVLTGGFVCVAFKQAPGGTTASPANMALAAPAGSVLTGVAVTAGAAALTLAALAGVVGTPTTASPANLALAAPVGSVSVKGITASPANLALAAPAGTVSTGQAVTASPADLTLAAPTGVAAPATTASPAGLTLTAPAGAAATATTAGPSNLALAAPAGVASSGANAVTASAANLALAAPAGTVTGAVEVTADWDGWTASVTIGAQSIEATVTADWGGLTIHATGQPYSKGFTPPAVAPPTIGLYDEDGAWLQPLPLAAGIAFRRELSAPGSLTCKLPMDDTATAQASAKRILKVFWKGQARQAARIDSSSVQIAVDGRAWRVFQLPGLAKMLGEMGVYPEYSPPLTDEIRALSTTRSIGYMSLPQTATPDTGVWAAAEGAAWSGGFYKKHFLADALTGPDPSWISKQWPPDSLKGGSQQWFRRVFTTFGKDTGYQILATADNAVTLYLDGEQIVATDPQQRGTFRTLTQVTGTLPAGKHTLAARVLNIRGGDYNPLAFLMTLQRTKPDGDLYGTPIINTNTRWQATDTLPGFHGGQVLHKLFKEADARSVDAAQLLTLGFSHAKDSDGDAWSDTAGEYTFDTSSGLLDVAQQLAASRLDFDIDPDTLILHAFNRRGSDNHATVIFDLGKDGGAIMSYEIDRIEAGPNTALIQLSDGTWIEHADSAAVTAHGRAEVGLSMGSTVDATTAKAAADALFDELPSLTFTMRHSTLDGPQPWEDYNIGDTISVPNETGTGHLKARVMAINIDATNTDPNAPPIVVTPELAWDNS